MRSQGNQGVETLSVCRANRENWWKLNFVRETHSQNERWILFRGTKPVSPVLSELHTLIPIFQTSSCLTEPPIQYVPHCTESCTVSRQCLSLRSSLTPPFWHHPQPSQDTEFYLWHAPWIHPFPILTQPLSKFLSHVHTDLHSRPDPISLLLTNTWWANSTMRKKSDDTECLLRMLPSAWEISPS